MYVFKEEVNIYIDYVITRIFNLRFRKIGILLQRVIPHRNSTSFYSTMLKDTQTT